MYDKTNNMKALEWKDADMSFAAYAAMQHVPLGGVFELTPLCTLKCKMCYVRLDRSQVDALGRELTAAEWISLAKEAIKAGTVNLLITGGEPMLRSDFAEIYTALTQMGFIITINTNATLITPDIVKLFLKYPPTEVAVTLYGASADTYERICGDASGFEKTILGLEALLKLPVHLQIRTTFIKDNINELSQIRSIAHRYTKDYAINTDIFKAIRGATANVEACRLSAEEIVDIKDQHKRYYIEMNCHNETLETTKTDHIPKTNSISVPPKILSCLAVKSFYWITWDGKMLPCGTFSAPYTKPLDEGFEAAWNRLPTLYENISAPAECRTCEFGDGMCPNCPAILQAETGSFDKPAPYSCEIAKRRYQQKGGI